MHLYFCLIILYFINTICTNQNLTILLENQFRKNPIIINIIFFLIKNIKYSYRMTRLNPHSQRRNQKLVGNSPSFRQIRILEKQLLEAKKFEQKLYSVMIFLSYYHVAPKNIWKLIFSAHTFYITYLDITLHSIYIDPSRHNFENCLPPKFVSQSYQGWRVTTRPAKRTPERQIVVGDNFQNKC